MVDMATIAPILEALADMTAGGDEDRRTKRTIPLDWFRWLPLSALGLFIPAYFSEQPATVSLERDFAERLAAVDQVRSGRSLRVGWLFVAGHTTVDGRPVRVFTPLVNLGVKVRRYPLTPAALVSTQDVRLTPLIPAGKERTRLSMAPEYGGGSLQPIGDIAVPSALLGQLPRLQRFAREAATAAGLETGGLIPAGAGPDELMRSERLSIVAGLAVYSEQEVTDLNRSGSLRAWARVPALATTPTAFEALYVDPPAGADDRPAGAPPEAVVSPFVLNRSQRDALRQARTEAVSVISGSAGTGKSHTLVAIACDALARGERVLVAARSDDAVDALLHLLERAPGPDPVVFGSNERRDLLATRLAAGQLHPTPDDVLAGARRRLDAAVARAEGIKATIAAQLGAEVLVEGSGAGDDRLRTVAPRLWDPATSLDEVQTLLAAIAGDHRGPWARRRRRQTLDRVAELSGAGADLDITVVGAALDAARSGRAAGALLAGGGLHLEGAWDDLVAADEDVRACAGAWLAAECRSRDRLNRRTLPAVATLATALRSGRAARRVQLGRLDRSLTRALPLWIGSLPDIDDLLPKVADLFDTVLLDEASSIDQPLATPALLRAPRAVIAGDPHQLRHVSFLSDQRIGAVLADHHLGDQPALAARLDVRRNSTFDVAAGVASVVDLDEHHRSWPHLVDWVSRRVYDGRVKVATRSPLTESVDCVDVERLAGRRNDAGVVDAEVAWVVDRLRRLRSEGAGSVGVLSPFRAQADAIEAAVLGAFSAADVEGMDLRIGTVHGFQGNERDVILASMGIGPEDRAWAFVEDRHLFTVLITRARSRLEVALSADPPPGGLVADWLAQADDPPGSPPSRTDIDPWTTGIAADLADAGFRPVTGYPVGVHTVDIALGAGGAAHGVDCVVHPDGPAAHIERHLALRRSGWQIHDAFASGSDGRRGEAVIGLLAALRATRAGPAQAGAVS